MFVIIILGLWLFAVLRINAILKISLRRIYSHKKPIYGFDKMMWMLHKWTYKQFYPD